MGPEDLGFIELPLLYPGEGKKYMYIQSGPKKCIHSLLINIFGINLNEISISG